MISHKLEVPQIAVLTAGKHRFSTDHLRFRVLLNGHLRGHAAIISSTVAIHVCQRVTEEHSPQLTMQTSELERWIRRDPAGRGLLTQAGSASAPCVGHLDGAANELATRAACVAVITGFYVPDASTPSAETDGPLGAILLADALDRMEIETVIVTDQLCGAALRAAMLACGVEVELHMCPIGSEASTLWQQSFWDTPTGQKLTHLVSIERVGPSLHDESKTASCRNVRGIPIDEWSADLYRLFEESPQHIRTIGIGDGGNEIGMGTFWRELGPSQAPPESACRTTTDWTILAGVSDWGAMALATAMAVHREEAPLLGDWTADRVLHGLEQMVKGGPAVDGITLQAEPTVDGLPFATYIQPLELMSRLSG